VKKISWSLVFVGVAVVLGNSVSQVAAQQAQQQAAQLPYRVAVVDVAQLIKQHPDFKAKQEALQNQVKQAEAAFVARQQKIQDKQKALQGSPSKPGTPEHQRQLDDIANDLADFEKDAKAQQRKFALENSKIMYETYQDIKMVLGRFAAERLIAQITDYRKFDVNPADPQSVAEDMDQKLVWFDKNVDVTEYVIAAMYQARGMQRPAAQAPQTAAGPAGTAGTTSFPR
jgi:Skp family chaperone for outer membrane proteins